MTEKCRYLFTDYKYHGEKIVAVNSNGKTEYTIELSHSAFDLACIDDNTVAVSTGYSYGKTGVMIIDLITRKVKRFVQLPSAPFGITFDGESLFCCLSGKGICMISCTDFSCTNITNTFVPVESYITTHGDMIVYTVPSKNTVSCLQRRNLFWEFKNESVLKKPGGITIDDNGNVFVVGIHSKNILVISPNGKQYKQIQTDITKPITIFFDKIKKQILVANEDTFANLYDISYC